MCSRTTATTRDGFEQTFGVNVLGTHLLVRLLEPALAPGARVVLVGSGTADDRRRDGQQLQQIAERDFRREPDAFRILNLFVHTRCSRTTPLLALICEPYFASITWAIRDSTGRVSVLS